MILLPEIQEFIYFPQKNKWVTIETPKTNVEIYMRKAKRIIYDEQDHRNYDLIDTLDLATWNADKPKHGGMTFILDNLETTLVDSVIASNENGQEREMMFQALYIENLTIPEVGAYLLRRGWKEQQQQQCYSLKTIPGIYSRSFYYWLGNKEEK